jgi:hypothetical protein
LRAIAVKKDDLFPTTNDDATSRRLLPYDRIDYGPWYRVEAGLIRLLHNTESVQQSPARPCPEVTEEVQGTSHGGKDSSTRIAAGTAINHDSQDSQDLSPPSPPQPRWDKDHRRLLIGDKILREYRHHPAKNQTTILASFEELGWSKRIDVPILKIKLQPTLRELNKGIKPKVIRFRADGTGKGIIWEYVGKATKKSSKSS